MATSRLTVNEVMVAGVTVPHPNDAFIGGQWVSADGGHREVRSPTDQSLLATVGLPSVKQVDAAVDAARVGLAAWAGRSVAERVGVCRTFCAAMEERLNDIGLVWAAEAGMPVRYSKALHKFGAVGAWQTMLDAAESQLVERIEPSPLGQARVRREPAGVVAAIMPYNGPLVTIATKVVPALLAGNAVVVKAALESQLLIRIVADCATGAGFPDGVLSFIPGDTDTARAMTRDPRVDLVSLTGGHVAAQDVIEATRGRYARTHLELGGKSPAIILDDAPLDQVLRSLVPGATNGTGQLCALLSRILVPRSRYDEITEALVTAWQGLTIGDPLDPGTRIGPLVSKTARDRAEGFVERAVAEGASVAAGGRRPPGFSNGWFYEPTLVVGVAPHAELAQREVFGPVTAVQTFDDDADALRLANDTEFGLAATVYTADMDRGLRLASGIEAGSVAINTFGPSLAAPFGGRKSSGWGREAGPEGITEFTELKQILIA